MAAAECDDVSTIKRLIRLAGRLGILQIVNDAFIWYPETPNLNIVESEGGALD